MKINAVTPSNYMYLHRRMATPSPLATQKEQNKDLGEWYWRYVATTCSGVDIPDICVDVACFRVKTSNIDTREVEESLKGLFNVVVPIGIENYAHWQILKKAVDIAVRGTMIEWAIKHSTTEEAKQLASEYTVCVRQLKQELKKCREELEGRGVLKQMVEQANRSVATTQHDTPIQIHKSVAFLLCDL